MTKLRFAVESMGAASLLLGCVLPGYDSGVSELGGSTTSAVGGSSTIGGSAAATGGKASDATTSIGGTSSLSTGDSGGTLNSAAGSPSGGLQNSGGVVASGGVSSSNGGTLNSGGSGASGGTDTSGGVPTSTGGVTASGGTKSASGGTGGTASIGGAATGGVLAGGAIATGGALATGGVNTTGGMVATGGAVATGGSNAASGGTCSTGGSGAGGPTLCSTGSNACRGLFLGAPAEVSADPSQKYFLWSLSSGTLVGTQVGFTQNDTVQSLGTFTSLSGPIGVGTFQLALYSDVNGAPGELLAETTDVSSDGLDDGCVNNVPTVKSVSQPYTIGATGNYWIMVLVGSSTAIKIVTINVAVTEHTGCAVNVATWPQAAPAITRSCEPTRNSQWLGLVPFLFAIVTPGA